jgi:hypothetical protein
MNQIDNIMAGIKPDTHCWDDDTGKDVWSYSEGLVRAAIEQALAPGEPVNIEDLQQQVNHWRNNADCERQRVEDDTALLRQALYALEWCEPAGTVGRGGIQARKQAIAALRERLKP